MPRWETCERGKIEGTGCKKKKKTETARVRTQESLVETAKVVNSVHPETHSQEEDPRTLKEPVERWRVQKKRIEKEVEEKEEEKG